MPVNDLSRGCNEEVYKLALISTQFYNELKDRLLL